MGLEQGMAAAAGAGGVVRGFRAVLAGAALGRRNGNVCTFSSVVSTRKLTSKNGVEYAGNVKMINNMNVWRTTRYAGIVQEFRLKKSMIMGTGTERCFSTEVSTAIPAFPPGPLATSEALKSPTAAISYDDSNHDRFPPGDPSRILYLLEVDSFTLPPFVLLF